MFPLVTCWSLVKPREKWFKYLLERASLLKLVGPTNILNHFENLGRPVVQKACWVNILVDSHVVQQTVLTRQALTCLPGQKLVEPCWVKSVLCLWVQQTCQQACTRFKVKYYLNQLGSNNLLARLVCPSVPGHKFVEPSWFRLVPNTFDPASLYKLWASFLQACRVTELLS